MTTTTVTGKQTTMSGHVFTDSITAKKTDATLETSGRGLWSSEARKVRITAVGLGYVDDAGNFGELRVFFNSKDWNTEKHGLIYTDPKFIAGLRKHLTSMGLRNVNDVDYSEQGMQGDNYVSLDVGKKFLQSWSKVFG